MGASKSDFFTQQQNQTAEIFKALGHPARIAIIEHILSMNSCICGDLVDVLPLSQATVSQHLRELKNANIIQGTIEGKGVCYCINEETIKQIKSILEIYIESSEKKNTGCC
ncbi:MAG: metalloregulator ArsR/SmtB family transcription factor [Crocinitomicaceae bacterium]|nr:metalloregulator ArsR/SmtB family transcription factor [Crocinitomicaceae bacterium]MCF8434951.1 metalloregulator ArsR/SmtB family transcription factor [Crocinitomicaceae bacterium]